jgi:23S rRNA (guanine745-N1)-methyltransferase
MLLACTVRGCGERLERREGAFVCTRGHSFDVARSGYLNLMQPHDRRSKTPGDSREAVNARRALLDSGFGQALGDALAQCLARAELPARARTADLGCGEGSYLSALARRFDLDGYGVDLSSAAIEAAAKRHPFLTWIVANADRRLPFLDASLDLLMSIDGRRNAAEAARVLAAGGSLLVAVSAEDDLCELREAVLGRLSGPDRAAAVRAEFDADFALVEQTTARERRALDAAGLAQLAAASYRCGRRRERDALASLQSLELTTSHRVLRFRRRGSVHGSRV